MKRRISISVLTVSLALLLVELGLGQTVTPPPGVSGYSVSIESDWVAIQQGFVPVRITIATNPSVAVGIDERFTITVSDRRRRGEPNSVKLSVILPTGASSVSADCYVPMILAQSTTSLLIEKGEPDGQLDRDDLLETSLSFPSSNRIHPSILLISSEFSALNYRSIVCFDDTAMESGSVVSDFTSARTLPSFEEYVALFSASQIAAMVRGNTVKVAKPTPTMVILQHPDISGIHPSRLPVSWIGLSGVEWILISRGDLKTICANQETYRDNLERWVAAGGVLVVLDSPSKFADELIPTLLGPERSVLADRIKQEWASPSARLQKLTRLLNESTQSYNYRFNDTTVWFDSAESSTIRADANNLITSERFPESAPFASTHYLNGRVVAVPGDMSQWSGDDWRAFYNTIAVSGETIRQRIGYSTGTAVYQGLKIPGVGEPPVRMFQVLIGLFILLAGPVMLLVLKKTQQMQYLFVAVPCLSAAVCLSLILYAVLVDGTSQWGRSQTVTTLDHRTNLGVSHARATYYSGGRPGPYRFPLDTIVLTGVGRMAAPLEYEFDSQGLGVSGGEIRPRNPHEMITVRSHPVKQRLKLIDASQRPDGLPTLQNLLGADVEVVVFRTDDGIFLVNDLASEATLPGEPIDPGNETKFQLLVGSTNLQFQTNWNNRYGNVWGDEITDVVSIQNSMIENILNQPNTYVAILKRFPLVEERLENVEFKSQLHVVRGQW